MTEDRSGGSTDMHIRSAPPCFRSTAFRSGAPRSFEIRLQYRVFDERNETMSKRIHARVVVHRRVEYRHAGGQGHGMLIDLSLQGCRIKGASPFSCGTRLRLQLWLPDQAQPVTVLEDEHGGADRRRHRERVQHHRLEGDQGRPEADEERDQRAGEDEEYHVTRAPADRILVVRVRRRQPAHEQANAVDAGRRRGIPRSHLAH